MSAEVGHNGGPALTKLEAIDALMWRRDLSQTQKLISVAIVLRCDEGLENAVAGAAVLARYAGVSKRDTVFDALKDLEALGLLRRRGRGGGRSNSYDINCEFLAAAADDEFAATGGSGWVDPSRSTGRVLPMTRPAHRDGCVPQLVPLNGTGCQLVPLNGTGQNSNTSPVERDGSDVPNGNTSPVQRDGLPPTSPVQRDGLPPTSPVERDGSAATRVEPGPLVAKIPLDKKITTTSVGVQLDSPEMFGLVAPEQPPLKCERDAVIQHAIDSYNLVAKEVGLPLVREVAPGGKRMVLLKARLKDHGIGGWDEAMANLKASKFCQGQNRTGWIATFDFVIKPDYFAKILEGFYGERKANEMADDARQRADLEAARRRLKAI